MEWKRFAWVAGAGALAGMTACGGPGDVADTGVLEGADAPVLPDAPGVDAAGVDAARRPDAFVRNDAAMAMDPDAFVDPDTGPVDACGDGVVAATGEDCDDGNTDPDDGCDATCLVEAGWSCDALSPTICSAVCGDGDLVGAEAGANGCDDGNTTAGDGCDASCVVEDGFACAGAPSVCSANCGDGRVDGMEACDDGANRDGDGCSAACAIEPGFTCAGTPSVCSTRCGDGVRGGTEACDDANTAAGDGCDAMCVVERGFACMGTPSTCATVCGDSITAGAEACDDGNTVTEACAYGARSCTVCSSTCTSVAGATSVCGDMRVDAAEEMCDDGNDATETACAYGTATCTGCDATCDRALTLTGNVCGDGAVDALAETCDDRNTAAGDGCSATCARERGYSCTGAPSVCTTVCGDSIMAGAETCDDGNTITETCPIGVPACTVCNSMCRSVAGMPGFCGDGMVSGTEQCDDGNMVATDGCNACVRLRGWSCSGTPSVCTTTCGDGIIAASSTEQCDDGWRSIMGATGAGGDGCSATCRVETGMNCYNEPSVCTIEFFSLESQFIPDGVDFSGTMPGPALSITATTTTACRIRAVESVSFFAAHTFMGDLVINVTTPAGTVFPIFDRPGLAPGGTCCGSGNNLGSNSGGTPAQRRYTFRSDDEGLPSPYPLINQGGDPANPALRYHPASGFDFPTNFAGAGEPMAGTWRITIQDFALLDTGTFAQPDWVVSCRPN